MGETRGRWDGWRGWALDLAFATALGGCLGLIGPFGTFVEAGPAFRIVYWIGVLWIGLAIYGLAIRAAVRLDGRWRVPGAAWLLLLILVASVPMSLIASQIASRLWPPLRAMSAFGWYSQSAALSTPVVMIWGVLTRRLAPFGRGGAPSEAGPTPIAALPDRLRRAVVCLQMEDHYVRAHTRTGSELVLISMREAVASLKGVAGERVHRSWWVERNAVTEVVADGRNLRLRLVNGLEAPISRSQVGRLRAAGWLDGADRSADAADQIPG
jgi:hypothetical protein